MNVSNLSLILDVVILVLLLVYFLYEFKLWLGKRAVEKNSKWENTVDSRDNVFTETFVKSDSKYDSIPVSHRRDYVFNLLSSTIVFDGEDLMPLRDYDEERINSMCDFFEEHYENGAHYTVSFDPNSLVGRVHKRFLQQLSVVADVYGFIEADRVPNFNNKCGYLINFYRK